MQRINAVYAFRKLFLLGTAPPICTKGALADLVGLERVVAKGASTTAKAAASTAKAAASTAKAAKAAAGELVGLIWRLRAAVGRIVGLSLIGIAGSYGHGRAAIGAVIVVICARIAGRKLGWQDHAGLCGTDDRLVRIHGKRTERLWLHHILVPVHDPQKLGRNGVLKDNGLPLQ